MSQIIIKPAIAEQFRLFLEHGRVFFLSAPCGFGKTVLAEALLEGRSYLRLSADDPAFALPSAEDKWNILLLDDLQQLSDDADWQALCTLIRDNPQRRFVLLSRGAPAGCLMAFQYAGLMTVLTPDKLLFDRDDIRRLFESVDTPVTESEITGILKESIGHPLGVAITARNMRDRPFSPEVVADSFREVFLYFETAIFLRFDLPSAVSCSS